MISFFNIKHFFTNLGNTIHVLAEPNCDNYHFLGLNEDIPLAVSSLAYLYEISNNTFISICVIQYFSGMKDLSYFVSSCLDEEDLLSCYFGHLEKALVHYKKDIDFKALEKSWRAMYPVAWADFSRFLKGWCPDHWKINSYSDRVVDQVLSDLGN